MDPLLQQASSIAGLSVSVSARLRLISEVLLRQIIEHKDHVRVFLHEYGALTGERRAESHKKRDEFENVITGLLINGWTEASSSSMT
jgi:hypothetical protein